MDYRALEQLLTQTLHLRKRPVAVKFQNAPPPGVDRFIGAEPSGCSFWRLAAEGRAFYTIPSDHYNCSIGSYTHNIPLPPERSNELTQTLGLMVQIGYLKMEEVPRIPRLSQTPGVVVYAPLGQTPVDPDIVIFSELASKVMLLQEAALRAGCAAEFPVLGRPTCMGLPAAMVQGTVVTSGCIGNRVYTDLSEGEMYVMLRGKDLTAVAAELETVVSANAQLSQYHQSRRAALASV